MHFFMEETIKENKKSLKSGPPPPSEETYLTHLRSFYSSGGSTQVIYQSTIRNTTL